MQVKLSSSPNPSPLNTPRETNKVTTQEKPLISELPSVVHNHHHTTYNIFLKDPGTLLGFAKSIGMLDPRRQIRDSYENLYSASTPDPVRDSMTFHTPKDRRLGSLVKGIHDRRNHEGMYNNINHQTYHQGCQSQ